jgi:hypothetical protein
MDITRETLFKIVFIVLIGLVLFAIVTHYNKKNKLTTKEKFEANSELLTATNPEVTASEHQNETFKPVDYQTQSYPSDCFPKDKLTSEDLLPKDASNTLFAQVVPAGSGGVADQNYLTSGYSIGINTVGSSLRNANQSIRSEPLNPQNPVSPWLNSTITGDMNRRPLEIGSDSC